MSIVKRGWSIFFYLGLFFNFLQASSFEDHKKTQMIQDLEVIKYHFEVGYAPSKWKQEYVDWNLNKAFEQAKNQVLMTPSITTKQFHQIVRNFVRTMKDHHVDVLFFSTETASLPFSVKGGEGRYFIDWVDPLRLPVAYYGIRAGDEILEFNERPIAEVIADLRKEIEKSSNPKTDQALAEIKLSFRSGMAGDHVPKGPLLVTIRSAKTDKVMTHQLHWSYTPEHIKNPLDLMEETVNRISFLRPSFYKKQPKIELPKLMMANPLHQAYAQALDNRPGGLGSRKSFLPPLGELLWSNEKQTDKDKDEELSFWHAYIYRHPQGYKIGCIRIPHYLCSFADVKEFGKILTAMEENTDALVIDQLHNFGGFVHIQYALASILTQQPLHAPYHRIKITQKEVLEAYQTLELIKFMETLMEAEQSLDSHSDSEGNQKEEEDDWRGVNYQELLFLKAYCELILEEWNQGQTLTRPTPILGIDKINPHPRYQYTKPILILINELDFSGGDFMPAILQDNQRAILFGARTAGAGGYISVFEFPNTHGIEKCSYTASIAERSNFQKIENLGITPDIEYQVTLDDIQNGYRSYIIAVNQAIESSIQQEAEAKEELQADDNLTNSDDEAEAVLDHLIP